MFLCKTLEQLNRETKGGKKWECLQQIGTYTKHTFTENPQIHNHKSLETGPVFTDQKWKAVFQSENGGEY